MKEKILRSLITMLLLLYCMKPSAQTITIDGIDYKIHSRDNECIVTKKNTGQYSGNLVIKEKIDYEGIFYPVTSIESDAFYRCTELRSISIPNSVNRIGRFAFYGCSRLTTITIPNSVNTIGESAFFECTGLSSITIGNSISYIGNYAFAGLRRLTSIYIDDIEAWCNILFSNNLSNPLSSADSIYINGENITDIIIPNGVKSIGNYAFYGCDALTSVTIPNSLTNIGESAFAYCDGLTSISIPNSVVNIEDDAFKGCHYLENVTIGISVENIGMSAFENCNKLSTINSLNPTPPALDVFCFSDGIKSKCDVFIPNGCLNKYMESDWKNFFSKIKETSSTKIDNILSDNAATTLGAFYDLLGNRRTFPVRGINITNGRKIIFK